MKKGHDTRPLQQEPVIPLSLFIVFDALMTERSVTLASGRLNVSQSAVSHALAKMRRMVGDDLFVRAQRGMVPTKRASDLYAVAGPLIGQLQSALQVTQFDPKTTHAVFRLAISDYCAVSCLDEIVLQFCASAPLARIQVISSAGRSPAELLGRLDTDFVIDTPALTPNLVARELFRDKGVTVAMATHNPLAKYRSLTINQYAQARHVYVPVDGSGLNRLGPIDQALQTIEKERIFAATIAQLALVPSIIARSNLLAVVPARFAEICRSHYGLATRRVQIVVPELTSRLIWHPRFANRPADQWFVELICKLFDKSAGREH